MLSFKQFSFPPANQNSATPFEPSLSTRRRWLYTKKNELNFGITLPGLCETTDYSTQMLAFFGIILLEVVPTIYGIAQGLLWEAVAAAILTDIFLAIIAHIWHDKILLAKNQLVVTTNPIAIKNLHRSISKYKFWTNFFYVMIFFSGCVKFAFFYVAYVYLDAIAIAILISYLLGAVLHVSYTGYFLYTSRYYWFVNSEFNQYLNTNGGKFMAIAINKQPISVDGASIQFNTVAIGLHNISKDNNNIYYFETLGILTDKELVSFINAQQNIIAQNVIAREGLLHQLRLFNAVPAGAVNLPNAMQNPNTGIILNQNN
jgi:hypothetical protein